MAENANHLNIFSKITNARRMFLESGCKKTGHNTYSKYYYFELSDILPTCLRICSELGLAPIISFTEDMATMTVYDCDDPSQQIVITSPMGSADLKGCHDVQNRGACETYNRRYLWFSLFEIVEADPLEATTGKPDSFGNSPQNPPKQKTNRNDSKTNVPSAFNPAIVWTDILKHFRWNEATSQDDKNDVKEFALTYLKDTFGISNGSQITELMMPEINRLLGSPIGTVPSNGPENFEGDSLD